MANEETPSREPRIRKTVRLTQAGIDAVQVIADRYGVDWSEAARRMLATAYPMMPRKWPQREF